MTPLQPFNVLIHLNAESEPKQSDPQSKKKPNVYVGLSFVECYVKEIRDRFGHMALFFYNKLQGDVIGVSCHF